MVETGRVEVWAINSPLPWREGEFPLMKLDPRDNGLCWVFRKSILTPVYTAIGQRGFQKLCWPAGFLGGLSLASISTSGKKTSHSCRSPLRHSCSFSCMSQPILINLSSCAQGTQQDVGRPISASASVHLVRGQSFQSASAGLLLALPSPLALALSLSLFLSLFPLLCVRMCVHEPVCTCAHVFQYVCVDMYAHKVTFRFLLFVLTSLQRKWQ